ncbi:MAG: hypothetical protein HY869_06370 [Chloroflexi bacterium]|nr:hypothetical protein [Chloroflexota bacterium]
MSESYSSKRGRWQRLSESLPAELRGQVSLRNVEAVAGLPPEAQARLAEALRAGLKRLPGALEQLRSDPNTPVADLLQPPVPPADWSPPNVPSDLADLIQQCFPDMPRVSAEALAESEVLDAARSIEQAHQQMFWCPHLRTDFVMLVLYGLMRQTLNRLEEIIEGTPALRQAFEQAPLPWKPNDWRNQDA